MSEQPQIPIKKLIRRRVTMLYLLFFLLAVVIVVRLVCIQFASPETAAFAQVLSKRILTTKTVTARRGDILMRGGEPIVTTLTRYQVELDFGAEGFDSVEMFRKNSDSLSLLLGRYFGPEGYGSDYFRRIFRSNYAGRPRYKRGDRRRHTAVKLFPRMVDYVEWLELKRYPLLSNMTATYRLVEDNMRVYPLGGIAKRTVGKVTSWGKNQFGVEEVMDSLLSGRDGIQSSQRIAPRFSTNVATNDSIPNRARVDGLDVVLTLDRRIQEISDVALRKNMVANHAIWGTAIVMEVSTGKILALSNLSEVSPGVYAEIEDNAYKRQCPGSTFKLASLLALVEDKGYDIDARFPVVDGEVTSAPKDKRVKIGNGYVRDDHAFSDTMTMKQAVALSSNIFFANAIYRSYKDHPERYVAFLRSLHLDRPMGLEAFGEKKPLFNDYDPEDREVRNRWLYNNRLCQIAYGYENELSPIQTATLYNAVANGGRMVAPMLVEEIRRNGTTIDRFKPRVLNEKICSASSLRKVEECLEEVSATGTAREYFVRDTALFRVAAKTGTAMDMHAPGQYLGSMAAYFPTYNPKYTVMVAVQNSPSRGRYYGAGVAGPVIRDIIYSLYTLERDWRQHFEVSGKDAYPTAIKGGEVDQMRKVASALDVRYRTDHHHSWGKSEADSTGRVSIHDVTLTEGLMPDVRGMGLKDALYLLESRGLRVGFVGHGRVVRQSIASGAAVRRGEYVTLTLSM